MNFFLITLIFIHFPIGKVSDFTTFTIGKFLLNSFQIINIQAF